MKTGKAEKHLDLNNVYGKKERNVKYSATHLRTAAMFSRLCGMVERDHQGECRGDFFNDIMGYTVESVILTMASLEAYIDEFTAAPDEYLPNLSIDQKEGLFLLLEDNQPVLEKYNKSLSILNGGVVFDKEKYPYRDTVLLRSFKNALVHFYPEWQVDSKVYEGLGEKLVRLKIEPSPFYEDESPIFPYKFMSYGCTQWAVKASYDFMGAFSSRAGVPFYLSNIESMFNTHI